MRVLLIVITILLAAISFIDPLSMDDQILQNIPTVAALIALLVFARRRWLSDLAYLCIIWFLWLHILGARYLYSNVPYDAWSEMIVGSRVSDWFGWQRNHYDRLVHLMFGVLCTLPAAELCRAACSMSRRWSYVAAVCVIMTVSAGYEVFEWILAHLMAPERAAAYYGQQGDMWDAQKDMALALIGSLIVAIPLTLMIQSVSQRNQRP